MNFLELCQDLVAEANIYEEPGPFSVKDQSGDYERVVEWIRDSWLRIQLKHDDWDFMRREFLLPLKANQDRYRWNDAYDVTDDDASTDPIPRFSFWYSNSEFYLVRIGEQNNTRRPLNVYSWETWRTQGWFLREQTQTKPSRYTIDRQDRIIVHPIPDNDDWAILGEYKIGPQFLEENDDTPFGLEKEYHKVIMWHAMYNFAENQLAGELERLRDTKYQEIMKQMERKDLQPPRFGGPLA